MRRKFCLPFLLTAVLLPAGGGFSPAADFDGDSRDDVAVFRPSSGLWAVRGVTRVYFGGSTDTPAPGDWDGDGMAEIAVFRPSSGLWAVRGLTRIYFGSSTDTPITTGGGGERTFDYVVKAGDSSDLLSALESDTLRSVFIPNGSYSISSVINVDNVRRILGESKYGTQINFSGGAYLSIEENYCQVENLYLYNGGDASHGCLHIPATDWVTVENCRIGGPSTQSGLRYESDSKFLKVSNCYAVVAGIGFEGEFSLCEYASFVNCQAYNCGTAGFKYCRNLSNCLVDGNGGVTDTGFSSCERLTSCLVVGTDLNGFYNCNYISACTVNGMSQNTDNGFNQCGYISSSSAFDCRLNNWLSCSSKDTDSCN